MIASFAQKLYVLRLVRNWKCKKKIKQQVIFFAWRTSWVNSRATLVFNIYIYINNLLSAINRDLIVFADNTTVILTSKSSAELFTSLPIVRKRWRFGVVQMVYN